MTITVNDLIKALEEIPADTVIQVVEAYHMPNEDGSADLNFINMTFEEHFWYIPKSNTLQLGEIL